MSNIGLLREARRLIWITFSDPILDGVDRWAGVVERRLMAHLTGGTAGSIPAGEVRITRGVEL